MSLAASAASPTLSLTVPAAWSTLPSFLRSLSPVRSPAASLRLPFALSSAPSLMSKTYPVHSRAMPRRTAAELVEPLLAGDKRALARAISLVEDDDPEGWELVRQVYPKTGKASVIGFTGPPGVGKSTLIGALVRNA